MKSASRWRVIFVLLFLFSALYISYQVLYYTSLTQIEDGQNKAGVNRESGKVLDLRLSTIDSFNNNRGQYQPGSVDVKKPEKEVIGKPIFSGSILGIAPENWHLYTKQQLRNRNFFKCLTSDRKISWSKVNDDYCDCVQDGSDEPATSACINGRFYCSQTAKKFPVYIPSSRVNDGIRDCIDGSDEFKKFL